MKRIENPTSGSGHSVHICDCDDCGLSPKAIKNGFLLGGALWLVLIGITWGVLKIFN